MYKPWVFQTDFCSCSLTNPKKHRIILLLPQLIHFGCKYQVVFGLHTKHFCSSSESGVSDSPPNGKRPSPSPTKPSDSGEGNTDTHVHLTLFLLKSGRCLSLTLCPHVSTQSTLPCTPMRAVNRATWASSREMSSWWPGKKGIGGRAWSAARLESSLPIMLNLGTPPQRWDFTQKHIKMDPTRFGELFVIILFKLCVCF